MIVKIQAELNPLVESHLGLPKRKSPFNPNENMIMF
jgi:hypothetical protein